MGAQSGQGWGWRGDGLKRACDSRLRETAGVAGRHAGAIIVSTKNLGLIMLDRDGFRPNVGIILLNQRNQVFWGKRMRTHSWQFPQGGIKHGETPEQAMFRELHEEVGLHAAACAHRRAHPRLVALRGARPLHPPRRARPLPGPEADLVPAAADRPRQRPEPARDRPPRVRRLALERVLGAAGRGDRVQARRLRDGADRTRALPAAQRSPQPLPARGVRSLHRDDAASRCTDGERRAAQGSRGPDAS